MAKAKKRTKHAKRSKSGAKPGKKKRAVRKAGPVKRGKAFRRGKSAARKARKLSQKKAGTVRTARRRVRAARKHKLRSKPVRKRAVMASSPDKVVEDVTTLEQITVTCANCGRPFKVFKLKGLSLEGSICQRCSFGELVAPDSFE